MAEPNPVDDLAAAGDAHRAISTLVTLTGAILLAAALVSRRWFIGLGRAEPELKLAGALAFLLLAFGAIAIPCSVAAIFRRRSRGLAIANALLGALVIATASAMTLLAPDDVAIGPAFTVAVLAAVLLVIGALSSTHDRLRSAATVDQGDGRRFIYSGSQVVAIEHWRDGKLVKTEPFEPKIAGRDDG